MGRKTDNTFAGNFGWANGGAGGGGFTCGVDIADDGTAVCRTDCGNIGGIRKPNDTAWTQLFRWGENVSTAHYLFKPAIPFIYEATISATNSNKVLCSATGRMWLTKDGGASQVLLTGFKSGIQDPTFIHDHDNRAGGRRAAIDPNNENIFAVGHPVDGFYYSLDEGATWTLHPDIPAPINSGTSRRGVHMVFHRDSLAGGRSAMIDVVVTGRGVYRFTNGLNSTPTLLANGPTNGTDLAAGGNGRLYVCGNGGDDGQLWLYNGSSWSQPTNGGGPVTGMSVCVKQGD